MVHARLRPAGFAAAVFVFHFVAREDWRRGESNPGPGIFHDNVYTHSSRFKSRFLSLPGAGYGVKASSGKSSPRAPCAHVRGYPALVDVLQAPAGWVPVGRWPGLSGQGVVIIVCDYIVSYLFNESVGTSACSQRFNYPRRTRFAPFLLIL